MRTIADNLKALAAQQGIPLRTLTDVQDTIQACKRQKSDEAMASMMLRHGRLTEDARTWLSEEYPQ